jgi:hypothetical protein
MRSCNWRKGSNLAAMELLAAIVLAAAPALAEPLPIIEGVEFQPLAAQAKRIAAALESLGAPLTAEQQVALDKALASPQPALGYKAIQQALDPLCLAAVNINPESRVKVADGPAAKRLMQQGWRVFLIKVHNEAGVTAELRCNSPNAAPTRPRWCGDRPIAPIRPWRSSPPTWATAGWM